MAANVLGNSRRQTTRCGPPAWELGEGLTLDHKKVHMLRDVT